METFITARSRWCLALVEISTPGLVVIALVWTVGVTFMPILSRFSIGMIGLLLTSSINQNRRMKSSFMKCLDHFDEIRVNSHLASFCFMKSIYFFLRFLASSLSNSIVCTCRTILFYISEKAAYSPTTYLPGTFQVHYRECRDKWANALWPRYRVDVTSLLVPSLSTALSRIQYGGKRPIWGDFVVQWKQNMNAIFFFAKRLRHA